MRPALIFFAALTAASVSAPLLVYGQVEGEAVACSFCGHPTREPWHYPSCQYYQSPGGGGGEYEPPTISPEEIERERERTKERQRLEEAARKERLRLREIELREKHDELLSRLKTTPRVDLRSRRSGYLSPKDTLFGNASRETGEGFQIPHTVTWGDAVLQLSDPTFENVRLAAYLMLMSQRARGLGEEEEAAFLWNQMDVVMNRGKPEVVVPSAGETPEATKLSEQYKELAVSLAVSRERVKYLAERRDKIRKRLLELGLQWGRSQTEEPAPKTEPSREKENKLRKALEILQRMTKAKREIEELEERAEVADIVKKRAGHALGKFLERNPGIAPREEK